MIEMARENPDVEVLVRRLRRGKAAVIRGHYSAYLPVSTSSPVYTGSECQLSDQQMAETRSFASTISRQTRFKTRCAFDLSSSVEEMPGSTDGMTSIVKEVAVESAEGAKG